MTLIRLICADFFINKLFYEHKFNSISDYPFHPCYPRSIILRVPLE